MKKEKKLLLFLVLVLVGALLFSSMPISANENLGHIKSLAEARKALEQELLSLTGAGFVGIAHLEAEDAVIVFVEDEQTKQSVPRSFKGHTVWTEVTGKIQTLNTQVAEPITYVSEDRKDEVRPLVGGTSLSAYVTKGSLIYVYTGTQGMVTYDYKILSNAHVIAMEPGMDTFLAIGTPIIQPGSGDGGRLSNRVGALEAYIPINFDPGTENYADAAIGSIDGGVEASPGQQFDEEGNYWVEGWTEVSNGDIVRKSGSRTGVTSGEVIHTDASVMVWYGDQSAYFVDQMVVTQENWSFAKPGDSGSAVDKDGKFVGLVFAGSETHTIINKAKHIIDELDIAVEALEDQYILTVSSTPGGEVDTPGEGRYIYDAGTVVDLVAEPGEHYRFVAWTGDVSAIADVYAASTTITMDDSYVITANFELEEGWHSLTISSTAGGLVTNPDGGEFLYEAGTVVHLVAEPDTFYQFVNWTGDVNTIADINATDTTITMDSSYAITANFELIPGLVSLTTFSTPGGSVTKPGEGIFIYIAGTKITIAAEPDEDYQFVNWIGDVDTIADVYDTTTTITIDDNYSITANFESLNPEPLVQLKVSSTAGGEVTTPGEGIFFYTLGTKVNLVTKASSNYQFTNWSGDMETIADVYATSTTITMISSYSIKANFDGTGGTGSRCCIATAAYSTPVAKELEILREFRDEYLLSNPLGQTFVDFYYWVSPPIAQFITEYPSLKPIARAGLLPAVAMSTVAVNTTPAQKPAIVVLLVPVSVALAIWIKRRRGRGPEYT